jgi:hypothetical protein
MFTTDGEHDLQCNLPVAVKLMQLDLEGGQKRIEPGERLRISAAIFEVTRKAMC